MSGQVCARMGCGDTVTSEAYICLDYAHVYRVMLCEKHKKELEEFKGEVKTHEPKRKGN